VTGRDSGPGTGDVSGQVRFSRDRFYAAESKGEIICIPLARQGAYFVALGQHFAIKPPRDGPAEAPD
jgi:hypothetical protein